MTLQVLLLGASGIPGRNILSALLDLQSEASETINVTIVKRPGHTSTGSSDPPKYAVVLLSDFSLVEDFVQVLQEVKPNVVISALNAEPAPVLDNHVVDALVRYREITARRSLYVNGYTLDLLHSSVEELSDATKPSLVPKIEFAIRLKHLAKENKLDYCTIVNAAFLDYCLIKGYTGINLAQRKATLVDDGKTLITGCSLDFVGRVVALVTHYYAFGSDHQKEQVRNRRLRVAEVKYSGSALTRCVEQITGQLFELQHESCKDILEAGKVIRYLNWAGTGASDLSDDGFAFGRDVIRRKSLMDLCLKSMQDGQPAYERIGG